MGFSRQEYWRGLQFPSLGDLPDPGIKPLSSALQADSLPAESPGKTHSGSLLVIYFIYSSESHHSCLWSLGQLSNILHLEFQGASTSPLKFLRKKPLSNFRFRHLTFWGKFFFLIFIFIYLFIFISWKLITFPYCSGFCHTLTWISHGFTCIPHPDHPSHLPLYPIPLGRPSVSGRSTCLMYLTWAGDLFHPR